MNLKQLIIPAILAALITGCSSTPDADQNGAPVESRDNGIATVDANNLDGRGLPRELTDPKSILSKRSVYFDYDKFDIKAEYKDLVAAHAKFLSSNRQFKMLIQGNTDERGSREYNLGLGERRGNADGRRDQGVDGGEERDEEAIHADSTLPRPRWVSSRARRASTFLAGGSMTTASTSPEATTPPAPKGSLDRFFEISRRGSTIGTEIRGGIVTFFTMAYILALNPLIIGTAADKNGKLLNGDELLPLSLFHRVQSRRLT